MIIKNKTVFVFDAEVFPNLFTLTVKNTENNNKKFYEISERKNDLESIVKLFLNKKIYFCGYNNLHYDDPIVNFLILHFQELIQLPYWEVCQKIKELSDKIITSQEGKFSSWSKYKYAKLFPSWDILSMMFSAKLRVKNKIKYKNEMKRIWYY